MKLAVFFPGIGYHCDKPLLYYAKKLISLYFNALVYTRKHYRFNDKK